MQMRFVVQRSLNSLGYRIERAVPSDLSPEVAETVRAVADYTKTTPEARAALCSATEYVVRARVPGDVVECGVWRGGSMMAVALTLRRLSSDDRTFWLYDTFAGMTKPGEHDVRLWDGAVASTGFDSGRSGNGAHEWARADLTDVRHNLGTTGYPAEQVRFVVGSVEDTIPDNAPEQISLLRLDTDFHDSTRHELEHLWPRLSEGGVLIVDDYGSWRGARKAVDDFFAARPVHLVRIDPSVYVTTKGAVA